MYRERQYGKVGEGHLPQLGSGYRIEEYNASVVFEKTHGVVRSKS